MPYQGQRESTVLIDPATDEAYVAGTAGGGATAAKQGVQYNGDQSGRIFTEGQNGAPAANANGITRVEVWDPVTLSPATIGKTALPGGIVASANITPSAAAYGALDLMAQAAEFVFTFADGSAIPTGSLIRILTAVMKIGITAVPSGQTSYTLQCYGQTPTGTPQADNDLWAAAAGDQTIYQGAIDLGTPADLGAFLYIKKQYVDFDIKLTDGEDSIFGQLVTVGAHTATAVARQILLRAIIL